MLEALEIRCYTHTDVMDKAGKRPALIKTTQNTFYATKVLLETTTEGSVNENNEP